MRSHKDRMLAGELYDPADPELVAMRRRARDLTHQLNQTRDEERELRATIFASLFGAVGANLWLEPPFYCDYGLNIHLGSQVFFNFNCVILDVTPVTIGDRVLIGPAVQIYAGTHPVHAAERRTGLELGHPVSIGSDVWIGGGVILCPGVTVGAGSVIGAGSVVTRDVPAGVVAVGNPCRVVRTLNA